MATAVDDVMGRLRWDTPFLAPLLQIVTTSGKTVPFSPKPEQLRFDAALEAQRAAGQPMRAIILKARRIGFSTWVQAKMIQRVTQQPNHRAMVLAHLNRTAGELFDMGKRMWDGLPDDPMIKPRKVGGRKARLLELGNGASYESDNAKEFEAGRGLLFHSLHCSEVAFFPDAQRKLTGLMQTVPDEPDTLVVYESTANGQNYFKELWDQAEAGESDFIPFFSAWFEEPGYRRAFANQAEQDDFAGNLGAGSIGEDEAELQTAFADRGFTHDESLAKLHWRRWAIRNKLGGDVDKFHQEYPSTPEEAFTTSGRYVFDVGQVRRMRNRVREDSECRTGSLEVFGPMRERESRGDIIRIPQAVRFEERPIDDDRNPGWRIYKDPQPRTSETPAGQYVIGVDASGGDELEGGSDLAYHAIEVIDHRTREQVAEYRSRIDADMLAVEILKACLHYHRPWVAVEITGSWGLPAAKKLKLDFVYPFVYQRQRPAAAKQKTLDLLGWQTTFETKQMLIAELREMLREETMLIHSRGLAGEFGTYIRDERNRAKPEWGKTADRLMAFGVAVCVAREKPIRADRDRGEGRRSSTVDHLKMDRFGSYA